MGLTIRIKGMTDTYDCGYLTFARFRFELANKVSPAFGTRYKAWAMGYPPLTERDCEIMNQESSEGMRLLLCHSDCDGKLTPKECGKIYDAIKDYEMDMVGHNYGDMKPYNMLERWKEMLLFCKKNRVCMFFE